MTDFVAMVLDGGPWSIAAGVLALAAASVELRRADPTLTFLFLGMSTAVGLLGSIIVLQHIFAASLGVEGGIPLCERMMFGVSNALGALAVALIGCSIVLSLCAINRLRGTRASTAVNRL